jgi:hypothetical protein
MSARDELEQFLTNCWDRMIADMEAEGFREASPGETFEDWIAAARVFALEKPSGLVDSAAAVLESVADLLREAQALSMNTAEGRHQAVKVMVNAGRFLGAREVLHQAMRDGLFDATAQKQLLAKERGEWMTSLNEGRAWWHEAAFEAFERLTRSGDLKLEAAYASVADEVEEIAKESGKSFKAELRDPAAAVKKAIQRRRKQSGG